MKIVIYLCLLILFSCNTTGRYQYFTIPTIEECRFLTKSIFCSDPRLDNTKIDSVIQNISVIENLTEDQKESLIDYFNINRQEIIKKKEFEIELEYKGFFRGYLLIPIKDEKVIKDYMDDKLLELDRYIHIYGEL